MRRCVLALALLVTACGIPVDASPETISVDLGDLGEIEEATGARLAAVSIYLVRDDRLVHVTRDLPSPAQLADVLESLVSGETDPEDRAGLRSSIPIGTELRGVTEEGGVARIDLSSDFAAVGGRQELLAVAQVVLTATGIEGVDAVVFELEGNPTDVPTPSGALADHPVTAEDYTTLLDG